MTRAIFLSISLIFLAACNQSETDYEQQGIIVSIEPFGYFAEAIAGDQFEISVIVPPGASPATYEPSPEVIRNIGKSELMIINGYLGFEMAWMERLGMLNDDIEILKLAESQELISSGSHKHGNTIHYTGVDPHFWVSPKRAMIIAEDIRDFIIENDPDNTDYYIRNYYSLDSLIKETDSYLDSLFADSENKVFMIFHPSLTYLASDYKLEQVAVEIDGKEPGPSQLKGLIDRAGDAGIKAVFVQREFNTKSADLISKEIGGETIIIDPLSGDWASSVREIAESISGIKNK